MYDFCKTKMMLRHFMGYILATTDDRIVIGALAIGFHFLPHGYGTLKNDVLIINKQLIFIFSLEFINVCHKTVITTLRALPA